LDRYGRAVGWIQDRRHRKTFERALAEEVERMTPLVEQTRSLIGAQAIEARVAVGRLPGASPRCERCGGPVKLERHHWGRGKKQWSSGWYCARCRHHHDKDTVRGSWEGTDSVGASSA
jgi:hypothetical protein